MMMQQCDAKGIIIELYKKYTTMSDFAFMRFMSNNLLTQEESQHKDEIIDLTEQILDANGVMR